MPQAQDGYGQGLQFGLSLFNSLQNASYLQGLEADRQERIEIQRQDAARRQQEFQYQQQQNELTRAQFLMQHPEAAPPEARVAAFNTIGQYVAGKDHRPITQLTLEGWDKEDAEIVSTLEATPDMQSFTNKLTEYEARAAEHPLRMEAFNRMKPALERIGKERGAVSTIKTLTQDLFSEDEINKMVKNSNPDTLTKMWEDKDTSKMLANQQIDKVMTAWHSGEPVSADKLRSAVAMARAVGRELGPKAEDLLKTHDTYTMYNESEEQLKTHQQKLDPLFKQIRANQKLLQPIKEFEPLKTSAEDFAGTYGKNPFSLIEYGGKADTARRQAALHDDFMAKQPQFAEELGKQAREASWRDVELQQELDRVQQDIRQAGIDTVNPNRNMTIHLLERKVDQIKRERNAIAPLVKYDERQDITTLKGVLNMEDHLHKRTLEVQGLRKTALSESDRRANIEIQQKAVDVNQKKATADGEMKLNSWLAQNPNATEAEIRGQASKIADSLKGTYKVAPDSNKMLENVITKRSHVTNVTMGSEEREKISKGSARLNLVEQLKNDYKPQYVGVADNWWAENVSGPTGMISEQESRFRANSATLVSEMRKELAGASQSVHELAAMADRLPDMFKSEPQYKAVLKAYEDLQRGELEGLINISNQMGIKVPQASWDKLKSDMSARGKQSNVTTKQTLGGPSAADNSADLKRSKAFKDLKSKRPDVSDDLILRYLQETGGQ